MSSQSSKMVTSAEVGSCVLGLFVCKQNNSKVLNGF